MSVDFNEIKKAVQRRNEFLAEHPELQPFQDEINRVLQRAGNNRQVRNAVLQQMLLKTWLKILDV